MNAKEKIDSEDIGKLVLRLMVGGLLIFHGISKAFNGVDFIAKGLAAHGLPSFIAYGVYVGEILAPVLIILGLWTRLSGLVVAFDLLVAILLVRLPAFFTMSRGGGWSVELDAFFLLSGLAVFFLGPGRIRLGRGKGIAS